MMMGGKGGGSNNLKHQLKEMVRLLGAGNVPVP